MNYLLINLAVADMMVALFVAPRFLLSHLFTHPAGATGTLFCKLLTGGNLTWIGGAASVFTLVAIAFERYYAVMHPYRIRGKLTYGKLKVCVCVCVLFFQVWPASHKMSVTIFAFYLMSLVSTSETTGEQCKVYQVPIHGKALRGHTYKTAKAGELFRCYVRCERDPACLSCNFKHAQEICEMNNETKETKPNDFITDEQSYYIKRTGGGG